MYQTRQTRRQPAGHGGGAGANTVHDPQNELLRMLLLLVVVILPLLSTIFSSSQEPLQFSFSPSHQFSQKRQMRQDPELEYYVSPTFLQEYGGSSPTQRHKLLNFEKKVLQTYMSNLEAA